nr:MAG TPA: Endodeoxyribonuclease RusA [Caudoviricetes sp.]
MTKVKFNIAGQVPSKKNNKRLLKNSRTGKMFIASSEKFNEWHNQAMMDLCFRLNKDRGVFCDKQVEIELTFYNSDNRRHDLDNMISSVLDLLVDAEFIDDDCCRIVNKVVAIFGGVDRQTPRVEVEINSVEHK